MTEIQQYNIFVQNTTRIIKNTSAAFLRQKDKHIKKNHPTMYSDLIKWYIRIFQIKPQLNGCAMTFIEKFAELKVLNETQILNRMKLTSKLKDGKIALIDNVYYSNKSKHLTNEICTRIHNMYGIGHFEYYVQSEDLEEAVILEDESVGEFFLDETLSESELFTQEETIDEIQELDEVIKIDFQNSSIKELKEYAKLNNIGITSRRKQDIIDEINKA